MTFKQAVKDFYFYLKGNNHSPLTAQSYRAMLETFLNQEKDVGIITLQDLQAHLKTFAHLSPATMNLHKACLRSLFHWLMDAGHLNRNPATLLKAEKIPVKEARYLSTKEVQRFRQAIKSNPRDNLLFSLYLMTGLRLSEALSLSVGQVKKRQVIEVVGKGRKSRKVYLSKALVGMIKEQVKGRSDHEPVFLSIRGTRLHGSTVWDLTRAYLKRAGIRNTYSPHSFRHTFLTEIYSRTKDLRLTQELAGHSSPAMTARYAHVGEEEKRRAVINLYQ